MSLFSPGLSQHSAPDPLAGGGAVEGGQVNDQEIDVAVVIGFTTGMGAKQDNLQRLSCRHQPIHGVMQPLGRRCPRWLCHAVHASGVTQAGCWGHLDKTMSESSPAAVSGQRAGLGMRRRVTLQQIDPAACQPLS